MHSQRPPQRLLAKPLTSSGNGVGEKPEGVPCVSVAVWHSWQSIWILSIPEPAVVITWWPSRSAVRVQRSVCRLSKSPKPIGPRPCLRVVNRSSPIVQSSGGTGRSKEPFRLPFVAISFRFGARGNRSRENVTFLGLTVLAR